MALVWESGLDDRIFIEDNTSVWCEVEERVKWFENEAEQQVMTVLGVTLDKEARKSHKNKLRGLKAQAFKYDGELTTNPNHKCTQLYHKRDMSHTVIIQERLKRVIAFLEENVQRVKQENKILTLEEVIQLLEANLFQLLSSVTELQNVPVSTKEEKGEYLKKVGKIKSKMEKLGKEIQEVGKKEGASQFTGKLNELQRNLADTESNLEKMQQLVEIKFGLNQNFNDKQIEVAKKNHDSADTNLFEL